MSHVFISYSRQNKECVYRIVQSLKAADFDPWIDTERIELSEDWLNRIRKSIRESRVFILFWSKAASESKWVKEELRIAEHLSVSQELKILTIRLDNTPISDTRTYDHYAVISEDCGMVEIEAMISRFPKDWRTFSTAKILKEQAHKTIDGTSLVSVRYDQLGELNAYIVGKPEEKLPSSLTEIQVCLQFFQSKDKNMLAEVYSSLDKKPVWILHITGPDSKERPGTYGLDNNKPDEWMSAILFMERVIKKVASESTLINFFTLTPAALIGGLSTRFSRFWHVRYYNWTGDAEKPYSQVVDIPRNFS